MVFYDKEGNPCCYSDDFVHIYSYEGEALGYLQDDKVWNYDGRYLGLFQNNWVIDKYGYYLFFTENAIGGPLKPLRKLAPLKSLKELRPLKSFRELAPLSPMPICDWSELDTDSFFGGY